MIPPATASAALAPVPTPRRWWLIWIVFALLVYTPFIDIKPNQGNVQSDLAAIESLVVRGTFFIDDSPFADTIDKFRRPDGRFFSQKSPLFHLAAAPPALALRALGFDFAQDRPLFQRVLTVWMVILPMGWLLGLFFDHPWLRRRPLRDRLALTLLLAPGSLLTPFALTLNHYTLASATLFCAVRLLARESAGDPALPDRSFGLRLGFWIAASLSCDVPPAFLFGAGVFCFLLCSRRRALAWLIAGAAPLALLYAALNVHIIGSPLPPNLHESEMLYYPGSYWSELKAQADAGNPGYYQASYVRRLYHATLGHKGVFWMWPLLTLAVFAAVQLARGRASGWQLALAWVAFPLVAIGVTMRWAFDLSGGAYGIRHVFAALVPLYGVLGHPALAPRLSARAFAWLLGLVGVAIAAVGMINPWSHNVLSAYPPLENIARYALAHPEQYRTHWIEPVIAATSVDPSVGWMDLGQQRTAGGDLSGAEHALRQAIQADPQRTLPYFHLGVLLDKQGRSQEAILLYRHMLKLDPQDVSGWSNLGFFALNALDWPLAQQAFDRSEQLRPGNASAALGRLLILDRGDTLHPEDPRVQEALGQHPDDPRISGYVKYLQMRTATPKP
jgi:hypothetical protein